MSTIVIKYGVPSRWQAPDIVLDQIRLAHRLSNQMVEIEHNYLLARDEVFRQHPEVARTEEAVEKAEAQLEQIQAQVRRARVLNATKVPTDVAKAEVKAARTELAKLRAERKAAKAEAKEVLDDQLKATREARSDARVAARKAAVDEGLFWATATDVLDKAKTAEKLVANAWKQGKQASRRFRRFDGSGTITTQIMWQSGMPKLTPAYLAEPTSARRNVFMLTPHVTQTDFTRPVKGIVKLQVAAGKGNTVDVPVLIHRPLFDDSKVCRVQLTRTRIGTQIRHAVCITIDIPDPEPKTSGIPFTVVTGWSTVPDSKGAIRVARISCLGDITRPPVPPPVEIQDIIVPGHGEDGHGYIDVIYPATWRRLAERSNRIRGYRDQMLDLLRPLVAGYLRDNPEFAEKLDLKPADVEKWRAARRFSMLAMQWPEGHVLDEEMHLDFFKRLTDVGYNGKTEAERAAKRKAREAKLAPMSTMALWRLRDRHLEDYAAHGTAQLLARRKHKWRVLVAWMSSMASDIILDAPNVASLREVPAVEEGDSHMNKASRAQIQLAAPGELAALVRQGGARRGINVIDARKKQEEEA
jgi:hypothetical protein